MEVIELKESIKLVCVTAQTFPEGIQEAFDILKDKLPGKQDNELFGISYPGPDGKIVYKASAKATELIPDLDFEEFIIPAGKYLAQPVPDFANHLSSISEVFQQLLTTPLLERFPCVEWYKNETDLICMVKIKN